MFMGEYIHTVDAKGRVIIPSKFREDLGEEFVITLGLDGCLFAYPNSEWQIFVEKLKTLPGTKDARQLQRYFMAGAAACQADKQGRILIPAKLREKAALDKDIVFVGVLNKIEIWNKERWDQNNTYDDVDDIAEHMSQYGINF
ncbi:division/cell wall cluster transcriptional repressor MraZ [Herbinix luporum]|jgi:MraZ protein|uniref:Transcriptional regulator MraZ n=1 Tax=Herbinix luporum TaxID=1679721 RepID=A0A0K8J4G0_9FIRM|nr:division/cell wall cluster transcriptional repressor MraZ [Herbinix luporum]MDI9489295.1 division/cell wall cluster transcriptional repressor MraZ [Bacillota bacterium]CUH92360.1 Protein MraZ [Herbinix luporum]HHT58027.1 division/cell wall cluster transcriptional repressor MraZ [Herbinix luporum]